MPPPTIADLNKLKKKYSVSAFGSKSDIAFDLWRVRGHAMSSANITTILPLLPPPKRKEAKQLLAERGAKPITNYKGMWKKAKKPVSTMTRGELVRDIMSFAVSWEKITTRHMDWTSERLAKLNVHQLRREARWYYSDEARLLAEDWLRQGTSPHALA